MKRSKQHPPGPARAATDWRRESAAMVRLAVPLVLTQLSYMAVVTTDVVMMGWLGPESLAAGTLAWHFYLFFVLFALGVLGAVAPVLAQHLGARRFRRVRRTFRHGAWLAVILAASCAAVIWQAQAILLAFGQDPDLAAAGQSYLRYMVLGLLPGLWQMVLSEFLAAHVRPRAILVVSLLGVGLNGIADYALMFGQFGFPRLGLDGAGIASALVNAFMFLALLGFVLSDRRLRRYRLLGGLWRLEAAQFGALLRIGLPIAVTGLAEVAMFLAAALLMGLIGTAALAAHAVAGQCAAIVYMVPLGLAQAATVRVGRAAGAGDTPAAARSGWVALALGSAFAVLPAMAFLFLGDGLVRLYLDGGRPENRAAIDLAVSFLAVAAFFQIADSAQAIALGALRGLKDTRAPMLVALFGYWGLGLPLAALFGIALDLGGQAIWASLAAALTLVAALLVRRFRVRAGRPAEGARPVPSCE